MKRTQYSLVSIRARRVPSPDGAKTKTHKVLEAIVEEGELRLPDGLCDNIQPRTKIRDYDIAVARILNFAGRHGWSLVPNSHYHKALLLERPYGGS